MKKTLPENTSEHVTQESPIPSTPDEGTYVQRTHKDKLFGLFSGTKRNFYNFITPSTRRRMRMSASLQLLLWRTSFIWDIKMTFPFFWTGPFVLSNTSPPGIRISLSAVFCILRDCTVPIQSKQMQICMEQNRSSSPFRYLLYLITE